MGRGKGGERRVGAALLDRVIRRGFQKRQEWRSEMRRWPVAKGDEHCRRGNKMGKDDG